MILVTPVELSLEEGQRIISNGLSEDVVRSVINPATSLRPVLARLVNNNKGSSREALRALGIDASNLIREPMNTEQIYELKNDFVEFGKTAQALSQRLQPLMSMVSESSADMDEMQVEALTTLLNRSSESCDSVNQLVNDLVALTEICSRVSDE